MQLHQHNTTSDLPVMIMHQVLGADYSSAGSRSWNWKQADKKIDGRGSFLLSPFQSGK
jgi:hypothetical protein